jgi:tRNA (guanine37-N1)-methyltransferase
MNEPRFEVYYPHVLTSCSQDGNLVAKLDAMSLFRPPIVRSAAANLDRSLFSKTIPTAAARIPEPRNIARIQNLLTASKELLRLERLRSVRVDPDPSLASKGGKCLLLNPDVKAGDSSTWSETLKEASKRKEVTIIPYDLELDYNYWQYSTYVQKHRS